MTDEELDASLQLAVGMTWDEIAATHDMRCGACRGGMLTVEHVDVTERVDLNTTAEWLAGSEPLWQMPTPTYAITSRTVTLRCATCGVSLNMPLNAKEE